MSKNRITGGEGFWVLMILIVGIATYPKLFIAIFIILAILIVGVLVYIYANRPVCPSCQNKGDLVFLHRNIDGGPDRRYRYNPLVCPHCNTNPNTFTKIVNRNEIIQNVVSCHYVSQPGMRRFEDCQDYPKSSGEKCKKCWIIKK